MAAPRNTTFKKKTGTDGFQAISLKPVGQSVRPIVKKILPQKLVVFQQLFGIWPELAAATEATGTIPEKLTFQRASQKDACLSLWARTGSQAMEVSYNKTMLIGRINSVFGFPLVNDIKVTAHPPQKMALTATPPAPIRSCKITSQSLDKTLNAISNPALKNMLGELGGLLEGDMTDPIQTKTTKGEK